MRARLIGLVVVAGIALAGCATGAPFRKIETIPSGKAVIYIYRPSALGPAVQYDVKRGDTVITTMKAQGYYPYITDPGEVELWAETESKASVTLDVKPGEVYFVKAGIGMGFFVGRPRLQVVPREEGEKEIAECCKFVESEASK
ncbi:MAG TPA: DUF2846 domain-containing protein [Methylomirabilota bacterium]|jgi:hypothetical protein|nr:DUF2846 domain-containing protein [Methylomirabilota bacterium]